MPLMLRVRVEGESSKNYCDAFQSRLPSRRKARGATCSFTKAAPCSSGSNCDGLFSLWLVSRGDVSAASLPRPSEVYAAMGYYFDYQEEIDDEIRSEWEQAQQERITSSDSSAPFRH
jgi:hypothetical protein